MHPLKYVSAVGQVIKVCVLVHNAVASDIIHECGCRCMDVCADMCAQCSMMFNDVLSQCVGSHVHMHASMYMCAWMHISE